MPKFNDLDLKNWKEIDLNMDSLWMISERKKGGKHSNFYYGNFVPQIPEQRYTKKGGYCVIVIGDKYQNSELIPLGFGCMNEAQKVGFKLKSIIIKNEKLQKFFQN